MSGPQNGRRAAIVGTGGRARTYTNALAERDTYTLAALCDPNPVRMAYHNKLLTEAGREQATTWHPDDFTTMLAGEGIDTVVVTTVDALHDAYIVPALEAGCRVITEKPMTTDAPRCRRILDAVRRTGNPLTVTFNYRFSAVATRVYELLGEGVIGEVLSVHFEWLLDVRHGADYFRRWHRDKANSGGLMVHKASHHFDLINWWLRAVPVTVFGQGRLAFYGEENRARHGHGRDYARAHGSPEAADDPFAVHLADNPTQRALYLDAEHVDGYHRDQNVFGPGITIEDDMAVLASYDTGATMTYHLTAYSPWEGYRVALNGTEGRLELEVEETRWTAPPRRHVAPEGSIHGERAAAHERDLRIRVRRLWEEPRDEPVHVPAGGHGGADPRLMATLFDAPGQAGASGGDVATHAATERDGAFALGVGLAANQSFQTGQPVAVGPLIGLE